MKRRAQGFTLIEMVITLIILGILGAVGAYGISSGVLAHSANTEALDTLGKLRVAAERLSREIRQARRDPANPARYDMAEPFSASQLAFVKVDGTQVNVATTPSTVTLAYDDPGGGFILSDQLNGLSFSYLQADGAPAADATAVAVIEFELILTDAYGNDLAQRTRVALRNPQ